MKKEEFEIIVESVFDRLPEEFRQAIDNVGIVIEDYPDDEIVKKMKLPSKYQLLGLYQGVPLRARGHYYGMSPIVPDKISLYQKNIEASCHTNEEIRNRIYEVLIHEIGHYFGMSEKEIRVAGF